LPGLQRFSCPGKSTSAIRKHLGSSSVHENMVGRILWKAFLGGEKRRKEKKEHGMG
jgi:hypothetical protein